METPMTVSDRIERTLVLPAPRQRVWDAITRVEQFSQWFGNVRDIDLRVGGAINFTWENELSPYPGVIETIEPLRCFAFRWSSHAIGHPELNLPPTISTLVTFTLEEVAEGTCLTLVESGFAALPDALRAQSYQENVEGWQVELDKLPSYLVGSILAM